MACSRCRTPAQQNGICAHTTWFFETFVLAGSGCGYRLFHPQFGYLFNSYYNSLGDFWPRHQRGLLARPTVAEVYEYREHVDRAMRRLLFEGEQALPRVLRERIVLGLNHEQQHQELLLTDSQARFRDQSAASDLSRDAAETAGNGNSASLDRVCRRASLDRPRRHRLRVRQRKTAPSGVSRSVSTRLSTRHLRRIRRFHRRGRLPSSGVVVVRGLDRTRRPGLAGAAVLATAGGKLVCHDTGRLAAGAGCRSRLPP